MKKLYALLLLLAPLMLHAQNDSIAALEQIEEVVVKAETILREQGRTTLRVANSPLQHLPSVNDILVRVPGVKASEDGLEVIGRGTPLIFIDGKQVQSFSQVEMLQPNEILSIEIDRNPSAKYDASATSVVTIRTRRGRLEGLGVQLSNTSRQSRVYGNNSAARLNFNSGKFHSYLAYDLIWSPQHDYYGGYEINHLPGYSLRSDLDNDRSHFTRAHQLLAGVGYDLSPKSNLSFQYNLRSNFLSSRENALQAITRPAELTDINTDYHGTTYSPTHIFNATYTLQPNEKQTFTLSADYALYNSDIEQQIFENISTHKQTFVDNASDIFAAKAEYTLPIFGQGELLVGARYGHLATDNRSRFADASNPANDYDDRTHITDDNLAGYVTLSRQYEKWNWQAGLRYEGTQYYAKADGEVIRDRWDDHLFPSLGVSLGEVSLNYTSRISRPSISELNPSRRYWSIISWGEGNPLLRPTISHNVALSAPLIKRLNLTLEYSYIKDARISTGVADTKNPEEMVFKPINIERSELWDAMASYDNRWKWYALSAYAGVQLPLAEIPFLDETLRNDTPSWYFRVSNDFTITKSTFASASFFYSSRTHQLTSDYTGSSNLSMSFSQYALERKLLFTLSVNDLLRDQGYNRHDRYGRVEAGQSLKNMDTRRVSLTIRYNFNNYNNVYRRKSAGDDELNRL